jgi:hypothetical protein
MRRYIQTALHPERYHGHRKQPPFFEGWYYKLISADESRRLAVIPGIFLSRERDKHHAFVQVLDGVTGASAYFTYPPEHFAAAEDAFDVRIGPNHFRADQIHLELPDGDLSLRGDLRFENLSPWPVTLAAPGIMGWYGWLNFMECYHGVVSLDHAIQGSLKQNGAALDFSGGRGYIEKDWGQSFPSAWVWMQTNHFEQPGTCLTASIAVIPFIGRSFPGFIIGVWHDRQLYRLAKYTGAVVEKLAVTDDHVDWVVTDRELRLEMRAARVEGGLLHGPTREEMHKRVEETLNATVEISLSRRSGERIVHGVGRNAGLEVQADLTLLLA